MAYKNFYTETDVPTRKNLATVSGNTMDLNVYIRNNGDSEHVVRILGTKLDDDKIRLAVIVEGEVVATVVRDR